jgi:hypothetical protein
MADRRTIRSYRRVFHVDHRVYRVDRWALPVPGGVSLRSVAYFALALLAVLILVRLPGSDLALKMLGAPVRYIILPLAVAVFATQANLDGRAGHRFALSWLTLRMRQAGARYLPRLRRARPARLPVAWDADSPRLRRCRVHGPATVTLRDPVDLRNDRHLDLIARRGCGEPQTVHLIPGRKLRVR